MSRLIRSELLKLRTTHVWWAFGVAVLALTAVSLAFAVAQASFQLNQPSYPGAPPSQDLQDLRAMVAASLYTAGQFFGLMFAMLLGVLLMTNEYQHQTASATFLAAPKRTSVVLAKLATAMLGGFGFWLLATAVDVAVGSVWLAAVDVSSQLDQWQVIRAIALNLLAYAIWAVFGVGLGTLIRSQIAAVLLALILYVLTGDVARELLMVLAAQLETPWVNDLAVLLPYTASQLLVEGIDLPQAPPRWLGGVILVGYGVLAGAVGAALTRRRDIT